MLSVFNLTTEIYSVYSLGNRSKKKKEGKISARPKLAEKKKKELIIHSMLLFTGATVL